MMLRYLSLLLGLLVFSSPASKAQISSPDIELYYYLPSEVDLNPNIPTPESFFGFEVGTWHLRYDQITAYMNVLANASDRVSIKQYGQSYEQKPLFVLSITSERNQQRIDQIRKDHILLTDPARSEQIDVAKQPVVAWLGFSVHGNEPSGGNASVLVAYYLAAAQNGEVVDWLDKTVVLLDPVINPDGFNRFAVWANMHRGKNLDPNSGSREHNEVWPGGRTNHYWFDLNRDWLLQQHPESQGRLQQFHAWKPNVLTDHHEMGTNATFFFQPGIPSRNNPLTPAKTFDLTEKIAGFHADALDRIGSLYYSKESYDDFYYGKGSTYPDVNGAVGILFEQASSRGHLQESQHGDVAFPFTIRNQFTTALSTLRAVNELRVEMLEHQRTFFKDALAMGRSAEIKGYVFGESADPERSAQLANLLFRHNIKIHRLAKDIAVGENRFEAGKAFVAPTDQAQFRLLTAVFERRTSFQDSLFYDVSAWTLPYSFDLPFAEMGKRDMNGVLGQRLTDLISHEGRFEYEDDDLAYTFAWDHYLAPAVAYQLQKQGILLKVATESARVLGADGLVQVREGDVILPLGIQKVKASEIRGSLDRLSRRYGVDIYGLKTGDSATGKDLGSRSFPMLERPKVAIVTGSRASSYEVGEVWHLLDYRFDFTVTLLPTDEINAASLESFNRLILVNGTYSDLDERQTAELRRWVGQGNVLITQKGGSAWASSNKLGAATFLENDNENEIYRPYHLQDRFAGAQVIGGAIFRNTIDASHPLGWGIRDGQIYVFRNSTRFFEIPKNTYAAPLLYPDSPLAAGYISTSNHEKLGGTAGVVVSRIGRGRSIQFADNHNFRAFWYGSNRLFLNAIYFGNLIESQATVSAD